MPMHYYAVRPKDDLANTRIEKADSPYRACQLAFGRGRLTYWEWKDLGTRVNVIQSDSKRIALLRDIRGWQFVDEMVALRKRLRERGL